MARRGEVVPELIAGALVAVSILAFLNCPLAASRPTTTTQIFRPS
jgi:hypothetical protein